jgi:cobalt-zinc-cadmium efflux system protein
LGDTFSLGFAYWMSHKAEQPGNARFSYGYQRFSLLGALVTSLTLIGGSLFILSEVIPRLFNPEPTHAPGMLLFALMGVAVNGAAVWRLHKGKTLNERVVSWHLLEDALGWLSVLLVSIILLFQPWYILDPILSLLITIYVLANVVRNLRETLFVFLQGVPAEISVNEVEAQIASVEGVSSVHHTRLWSLDGEHHVLSTHVVAQSLQDGDEYLALKSAIKDELRDYPFEHVTIEIEAPGELCTMDWLHHVSPKPSVKSGPHQPGA